MTEIPLITKLYVLTVGIAFLSSLVTFGRDRPLHLNLLSVLLGIFLATELYSLYLLFYKPPNATNAWLYNPVMLIQFIVYALFFYRITELGKIKKVIACFLIGFPIFWVLTTLLEFGFLKFNSYVAVVGYDFVVFMCLSYYYQILVSKEFIRLSRKTEFWIATGLLIFCSCQMPFYGLIYYLSVPSKAYIDLIKSILSGVQFVNFIIYLLFIYAFLCQLLRKRYS